uniref:Uncharacterized protein n=1 Tax=Meloidogyne enterolobii TaxID=390850 RepID=A0A6V7X013_MELEN|nr:unnamed protein product [Meloidogyne enterolobii]
MAIAEVFCISIDASIFDLMYSRNAISLSLFVIIGDVSGKFSFPKQFYFYQVLEEILGRIIYIGPNVDGHAIH